MLGLLILREGMKVAMANQSLFNSDSFQQPVLGSRGGEGKSVPMQLEGCISRSGDSPSIAFISSKAKSSLRDPCLLPRDLDVSLPTRSVALFSNSVFLEQAAVTAGPGQQKAWQCQALIQGLCVFFMSDKQTGSLPDFTCFVF